MTGETCVYVAYLVNFIDVVVGLGVEMALMYIHVPLILKIQNS